MGSGGACAKGLRQRPETGARRPVRLEWRGEGKVMGGEVSEAMGVTLYGFCGLL